MLLCETLYLGLDPATRRLELPFELRQKSRLRTRLADGEEIGLFLPRGTVLRGGDVLQAREGTLIAVHAKPEAVVDVRAADTLTLMRAAYHLGNRHVQLQIGDGWLRLLDDAVLNTMLLQVGAVQLTHQLAPFEPEAGAYGSGHHHQGEQGSPARIHEFLQP